MGERAALRKPVYRSSLAMFVDEIDEPDRARPSD